MKYCGSGINYLWNRREPALRLAFLACWVVFAIAGAVLASVNVNYGSEDSITNLQTARSIAAGKGYSSGIVAQLLVPQDLHREVLRAPGVPYLLAVLMWVFGESASTQVYLNVLSVLLLALVVRSTLAAYSNRWYGDLAGLFVLLGGHFELISIWNNNLLALATASIVWCAVGPVWLQRSPRLLALLVGLIAGSACALKATYLVGIVPAASIVVWTVTRRNNRRALVPFLLLSLSIGAASAPFWLPKLADPDPNPYPTPVYNAAALLCAYDPSGEPPCRQGGVVGLDERLSGASILAKVRTERGWTFIGKTALWLSGRTIMWFLDVRRGFVFLLVLVGLPLRTKEDVYPVVVAAALMIPPLAESVVGYEERYLWPTWPLLLFFTGDTLRSWSGWVYSHVSKQLHTRARVFAVCTLALAALGCSANGARAWRAAFISAPKAPSPEWLPAVRTLPADAVVMSADTWNVAWLGHRIGVLAPDANTSPGEMRKVVSTYNVGYLLVKARSRLPQLFEPNGIRPVFEGREWTLFAIAR